MRVLELEGVSALASLLIDVDLLGDKAVQFGSPDMLILNSGGPVSELAKNSILSGPCNTRVIIRQPNSFKNSHANNALEGKITLNPDNSPITAEIEEWKHGCWYHSDIISANDLGDLLNRLQQLTPDINFQINHRELPNGPFWAGAISYDMVQWTQPISLQHIPHENEVLTVLWLVENFVVHAKEQQHYSIFGNDIEWVQAVQSIIENEHVSIRLSPQPVNNHQELSSLDDTQHLECIHKITNSIADGMFYQVNLGRFWSGRLVESPLTIFQRLVIENPAPFAAYVEAKDLGLAIVSSSPETLLRCDNRMVSTAPIKGTITRGKNTIEDNLLKNSMAHDVKERSEHRMLVDLMRNDLSQICQVGSVNIAEFGIESYTNVHHLVSHIAGNLLPQYTCGDALNAVFPGGSITGCPRTMVCAAIDQIEGTNRSFWTGSVGWHDPHNDKCSWNILIRTLEARKRGKIWDGVVGAGGGITIRSEPELEVAEAIWKSQALRKACGWLEHEFNVTNTGRLQRTELEIEQQFAFNNCGEVLFLDDLANQQAELTDKVLVVDNLDSFTLNIAHAIAGIGQDVRIISGRSSYSTENIGEIIDIISKNSPSHIILGPGPGIPDDSPLTMELAELSLNETLNMPVLGICLGHQALGLVDGYELIRDPHGAIHGTPVMCQNDGSGLFLDKAAVAQYVRYNSLILTEKCESNLIQNIRDSHGSIMGLRHPRLPIHGIQFHPESIGSENGIEIISAFLKL